MTTMHIGATAARSSWTSIAVACTQPRYLDRARDALVGQGFPVQGLQLPAVVGHAINTVDIDVTRRPPLE